MAHARPATSPAPVSRGCVPTKSLSLFIGQYPLGITSWTLVCLVLQLPPFHCSAPAPWLLLASMHSRPPHVVMTMRPPFFSKADTFACICATSAASAALSSRKMLTWCNCHASEAYATRHTPISPPAATATHFQANHAPALRMEPSAS